VLLNHTILVVHGLSEVLGALRQILLSYLVHLHSSLSSLRQGQVHVGPITWEVLPQELHGSLIPHSTALIKSSRGRVEGRLSAIDPKSCGRWSIRLH
jgi:hypothetical protein